MTNENGNEGMSGGNMAAIIILIVLFLGGAGVAAYLYFRKKNPSNTIGAPNSGHSNSSSESSSPGLIDSVKQLVDNVKNMSDKERQAQREARSHNSGTINEPNDSSSDMEVTPNYSNSAGGFPLQIGVYNNNYVKVVQQFLNKKYNANLVDDGDFGSRTKAAAQKYLGLTIITRQDYNSMVAPAMGVPAV